MCQFYVDMTKKGDGFYVHPLSALSRWIENEEYIPRIESILCSPDNITQLIQLFNNTKSKNVASSILNAFKSLIFKSKRIAAKLGDSNIFLEAIGEWFQTDYL